MAQPEVDVTLKNGSGVSDAWSLGCDIIIEEMDAEIQEIRVSDIIMSGAVETDVISVDVDSKNVNVMDLDVNVVVDGLNSSILESQVVPYENVLKITSLSPEATNEKRYAASAYSAKKNYDLITSINEIVSILDSRVGILEDSGESGGDSIKSLLERLVNAEKITKLFYIAEDGSIGTKETLFSEKQIAASGSASDSEIGGGGSSDTGSGVILLDDWDNYDPTLPQAIAAVLGYQINERLKAIEAGGGSGEFNPEGYATIDYVDEAVANLSEGIENNANEIAALKKVDEDFLKKINTLLSFWTYDEDAQELYTDKQVHVKNHFIADKQISAGGLYDVESGGGGTGSDIILLDDWSQFDEYLPQAISAVLGKQLHDRLSSLEDGTVIPTGVATTTFVNNAINDLVDGAPYAYNTIGKIAKAIQGNQESINSILEQIAAVTKRVESAEANIEEIKKLWKVDKATGELYTEMPVKVLNNFFATGQVAAGGKSTEEGGSSDVGGIILIDSWSKYDSSLPQAVAAVLGKQLHERLIAVEEGKVDLNGYATEAFVTNAINDLINGAPEAYDTLLEISQALQGNEASINDILTQISTKANKAALDELSVRVAANENKIASHDSSIDTISSDLDKAEGDISKNAEGLTNLTTKHNTFEQSVEDRIRTMQDVDDAHLTTINTLIERKVVAGNGLTGGGNLSADITLDVVSANDGITANADNIQLNTINNLSTSSETKPLSALQGKALNDRLAVLESMFAFEDGNIKTTYNLYSTKEISSGGKAEEQGAQGGVVIMNNWQSYDSTLPQALGASLGIELHNRLTSIENKLANMPDVYSKAEIIQMFDWIDI